MALGRLHGFAVPFFAFLLHLGQAAPPVWERRFSNHTANTGAVQTMHRRESRGMALAMPAFAYHRQDLP
jgi:hypothetical protein